MSPGEGKALARVYGDKRLGAHRAALVLALVAAPSLSLADGPNLAAMETAVTIHDPELQGRELALAREALPRIDGLIGEIEGQGRSADYLRLQRNLIGYSLRVADLAATQAQARPDQAAFFAPLRGRAAGYVARRWPVLLADAESLAADEGATAPEIPRPDLLAPWTIRDGEVLAGGEPVTLHGFVWQYATKDHSYPLRELGLNMQSIDVGPNHVVTEPFRLAEDLPNAAYVRDMRANALEAQEEGEVLELHTSPHYLPQWFPSPDYVSNSWMDTADFRRLIALHYRGLHEAYGDLRAVKTADIANEWTFCSASPDAMAGFRCWLARRYGSVEELNRSWGAGFAGLDGVPPPFGEALGPPMGVYQRRAAFWDWCSYNAERAAAIVRGLNAKLKEHYPGVLTHIKCVLSSYAYRSLAESFALGIDPERILPITDLIGTDASYIRGDEWVKTIFAYDYMKSICPGKPIFCSETHAVPYDDAAAPGEIRRGLFQRFVHGERLDLMFLNTTLLVPEYWTSGESPRFNIGQAPEALEAFALASADLQRLTPYLGAFNRREASVLIFYDHAADFGVPGSDEPPGRYGERAIGAYESLVPWDVKVGIATEGLLAREAPTARLIVLAGAEYVSDETVGALREYVSSGGHLLWLGENLERDRAGKAREAASTRPFLTSENVMRMPLRATAGEYQEAWPKVLRRAGISCPFTAVLEDEAPAGSVELLSAEGDDGSVVVFLANVAHKPVRVGLRSQGTGRRYMDLLSGERVDPAGIDLATDQVVFLHDAPLTGG